ncbi:MAG: SUMF1/EgtB/PvdO family nonheme iron enzyme [Candidatus Riflebacteria bacterium]|nr:SUMF1/EgtB/PvdO family nonheme iron enzyme [Candidatus Riflebacteria bacterium]
MNRKLRNEILLCLMVIGIASVLAFTGCNLFGNNPSGADLQSNQTPTANTTSVRFQVVLPDSLEKKTNSVNLAANIASEAGVIANITANANVTPTVMFELDVVNIGNASNPLIITSQTVSVSASGSASVVFTNVPVGSCVGIARINGGSWQGFTDFRGAGDLISNLNNIIQISPTNSRAPADLLAYAVEHLANTPYLYPKIKNGLVGQLQNLLNNLPQGSNTVYDDLVSAFVNSGIPPIQIQTASNVLSIDEDSLAGMTVSSGVVTFASPSQAIASLKVGQVLVGDITDTASSGVLCKVAAVSRDASNTLVVQTTRATLEEAFPECHIEFYGTAEQNSLLASRMRSPSSRARKLASIGTSAGINYKDLISLDGGVSLDTSYSCKPTYYFNLDISGGKLNKFLLEVEADTAESITLTTEGGLTVQKEFATTEIPITTLCFWTPTTPPLPILVPITYQWVVNVDGNVTGEFSAGIKATQHGAVGPSYSNASWTLIHNWSSNFSFIPPDHDLTGNFDVWVGPRLLSKVYSIAGPTIALRDKLRFQVSPTVALYTSVDVQVAAEVGITGLLNLEYEFPTIDLIPEQLIWQKQVISDASPTVSIMQPTNGASFLYGKDILITSLAQDTVGQVSRVDIYTDGKLLTSICSTPYTCVWLKPSAGSHQISAVAYNSSGQYTQTSPINVTVNSPITNPTILSVTPNPLVVNDARTPNATQTLTISGTNFKSGATVRVVEPNFGIDKIKNATFVSDSQLSIPLNVGIVPSASWSLQIINPDNTMSGQYYFPTTPVIASPTNVVATNGDGKVTLTWDVVTGLTYNVYFSASPGVTKRSGKFSGKASPYDVTNMKNGTTYYFAVTAENSSGESDLSSEVSATPNAVSPGTTQIDLGGGVKMDFVEIPAGSFVMGSPDNEPYRGLDEVQHNVTISKAFYMGKYLVTQEQYKQITGVNPSFFSSSTKLPVERVSWYDCVAFCNQLSANQGLINVYTISSGTSVTSNWGTNGYRLPTESEWEYACRAGTTKAYYWGDTMNGDYCWYNGNSNNTIHEVGAKLPNAWNLYDMSGNVWEWCWDWYGGYSTSPSTDPKGLVAGSNRVYRGGGWDFSAFLCRSGIHGRNDPGLRGLDVGFRLVRTK